MNGIDKELVVIRASFFVLAEAEQAQARELRRLTDWSRAAWENLLGPRFVILLVTGAILADLTLNALLETLNVFFRGSHGEEPRADACAQEVVRTTSARANSSSLPT